MAIIDIEPAGVVPPAPEDEQLTFQQKLKKIADHPPRDLTLAERAATSAPGRAILGIAERMGGNPVSRGVVQSPQIAATTASDLYLGATQKTYEVIGAEDAAKEVEGIRRKSQGIAQDWEQWNAQQDKQFAGGETMARVLRGASSTITDALTAGGVMSKLGNASKGNSLMMQYYATRSTQEAIQKNPGDMQNAIAHGLIDGLSTGLGEYVGVPTSALAGTAKSSTNRLMARAVARVKDRVPLPEAAIRGAFGSAVETGSEVLSETAHYFADVAAGIEKLDWKKFGKRVAETAATAGLTGAAATSIQPVVDAMRQRHEMIPTMLGDEAKSKHSDLHRRELELGIVKAPEVKIEQPTGPDAKKPSKEELETQRAEQLIAFHRERAEAFSGLGLEQQLFDLAVREQRVQKLEQEIDRYTTPTSAAQRELKKALGERRIEQIGQGEKAVENTPAGEVDFDRVRNAPLRAGDTKPEAIEQALVSDEQAKQLAEDAELAYLNDMERERTRLAQLRDMKFSEGGVAPKQPTADPKKFTQLYHGSRHKFDKFDLAKAKTGEGAQAFGHGLYFTDNKQIAEFYKAAGGTTEDAGNVYSVGAKPKPEQFLDWHKTLGQQNKYIKDILEQSPWMKLLEEEAADLEVELDDLPGERIYRALAGEFEGGKAEASSELAKVGIPGVVYDAGTLSSQPVPPGSKNYVLFNPDDAAVLSRNDEPAAELPDWITQDIENIDATVAERLAKMAETEDYVFTEIVPPKTRAQRRIEHLTRQLKQAKLKAKEKDRRAKQRESGRRALVSESLEYHDDMKDALPPSLRVGLREAAKGIRTPKQYEAWKSRVDKAATKFDRKLAKDSLAAAMAKAEKYATRPEDRSAVDTILSEVDTSTKKVHEQAKALVDWVAENPNAAAPAGYKQALEMAGKKPIHELSATEMREMSEAIEAVAARAAAVDTFQTMATDATQTEYAQNVVSQIAEKRPTDSGLAGEVISTAANIVFRPETIMASLSEDLRVLGWENIAIEGHRNYLALSQELHDDMNTLLRSLGLAPDRVVGATGQGGSALNVWRYEQRSIGGQKLTRGEALHAYAVNLDPEAAAILFEGGATLAKVRKLRKKVAHIAINEGTLREIGDFIGTEGRQIVEHAFEKINTRLRDAVNAQWLARYNYYLSVRNNYFPLRRDQDWVMEQSTPEAFLADLEQTVRDSYGEFGITKRREADLKTAVEIGDFFDVYARHIDTTARIHGYMGPVRDFHAVYSRAEVKQAITNKTSTAVYEGLLEAVKQQVLPVRDRDAFSAAARKLVHGSGAAILGLRIVTPFKNSLGLIAAQAQYAGGEALLAEAIAQAADPREQNRIEALLQTHSPVWRQRTGAYLNEATSGVGSDSRAFQPSGIADATLFHVSAADKLAGIARGLLVEKIVQRDFGIDPKDSRFNAEVAKEWERLLARTESTSIGLEMSGAQRAGKRHGLAASLTQFGSGASKTMSLLQSGRNDIRDGQYKRGVRKFASFGATAITDAVIGALFAATATGKEEELIDRVAGSLARMLPIIGETVNQAYRDNRDKKVFSGPQDTLQSIGTEAIFGAFGIYKTVETFLTGGLTDEGDPEYQEHAKKAAGRLSLLVGSITKLPTEGAADIYKRMANGLGIEGEERESLAKIVSDFTKATDISEPKGKLRAAIKTNDDSLFLEAIEEIHSGAPNKLTQRTMEDAVNGLFRDIEKFEKNPELLRRLTDSELRTMRYAIEQRAAMRSTLRDMLERNLGQIEKIVGVK